ncbi:MAG: hypothetical protein EHM58_00180 [Ignavibacteriae bacterium]|nr:MAG: hypothetical protein EHM58_00180 [Ignavibacteriota bacterium]
MYKLKYQIKAKAPLLIAKSSGERNTVTTYEYIPGTSVLGMLAGRYIAKNKLNSKAHENDIFFDWFLKGKLRFSNAYITQKNEYNEDIEFIPIPFSIKEKKNKQSETIELLYSTPVVPLKMIRGFGVIESTTFKKTSVSKSINFHHERDKDTGSSKKGIIFNYESIDKDQVFKGEISSDEKGNLEEIAKIFLNESNFYIGRSRNSQYGEIEFSICDIIEELKTNIEDRAEISLTFLSDVIIYNKNGFSTTDIKSLREYLEEIGLNIKIEKAYLKKDFIENYVSVWRLKKPSETCFKAGSCFLLKPDNELNMHKLQELQLNGIGERRAEGFGQVIFGLQKNDISTVKPFSPSETKISEQELKKEVIPEITQKIIKKSIREYSLRTIKLKALEDVRTIEGKNNGKLNQRIKGSLVSRLESFIKSANSESNFRENYIKELKDIAMEQLKECKTDKSNLWDFIMSKEIEVLKAENETLYNYYEPENDNEFKFTLYKTYFLTFFANLRKAIKKSKQKIN